MSEDSLGGSSSVFSLNMRNSRTSSCTVLKGGLECTHKYLMHIYFNILNRSGTKRRW